MRKFLDILNEAPENEAERLAAFEKLADAQRGEPELRMLEVQTALGGGVMAWAVEHIGDLTHRMAEMPDFLPHCGYEFVKPKVERGLRLLTSGYGFKREHEENLRSNARYRGMSLDELTKNVRSKLRAYASAHKELKVYNPAQEHARNAAIALGEERFGDATTHLYALNKMLKTPESWTKIASAYDPNYQSN
jgi:hypothetical protein